MVLAKQPSTVHIQKFVVRVNVHFLVTMELVLLVRSVQMDFSGAVLLTHQRVVQMAIAVQNVVRATAIVILTAGQKPHIVVKIIAAERLVQALHHLLHRLRRSHHHRVQIVRVTRITQMRVVLVRLVCPMVLVDGNANQTLNPQDPQK